MPAMLDLFPRKKASGKDTHRKLRNKGRKRYFWRSKSELVLPLFDPRSGIRAVLDVDSGQPAAFSQTDVRFLEMIAGMVYDR